ncbi:MAG TPA: nitrilase [Clostridia bacterium]|nr:nitrilase [Clostridia bacterium]
MLLDGVVNKILTPYLSFRTRPRLVRRFLHGKNIKPGTRGQGIKPGRIRVAAAQVPLYLVEDPLEWVELIYRQVVKGVEAGAQLIVFPEHITLHLLGLVPGVKQLARLDLLQGNGSPGAAALPVSFAGLFGAFGAGVEGLYRATMSSLAGAFGIYIMGGSRLVPDDAGKVVNQASLFDPQGRLVGSQNKAHLLPLEAQWGICRGNRLEIFDTALGKIAFPVCMDATYFETFRILSLLGAEIVIIPIANPEEYNLWKALRGIWPRVQESCVYGIKSALVGKGFFGLNFTGKAGIFAPLEIQPPDGLVALAQSPDQEDLVVGDLDLIQLRAARARRFREENLNLPLYRRYFPAIYAKDGAAIKC